MPKRYRVTKDYTQPKPMLQVMITSPTRRAGEFIWLVEDNEPLSAEEIREIYKEAAESIGKLAAALNALPKL